MKKILFVSTRGNLTSGQKEALEANFGESELLIATHIITDASVLQSQIDLCDQIVVHTDSNCFCQQFTWLTDKPVLKMTVKGQKITLNPVVKVMSGKASYNQILKNLVFRNPDACVTNTPQEMLELLNILEAHKYSVKLHNLKHILHSYRRCYLDSKWMWDEDIAKTVLKSSRFYHSMEERAMEVYGDFIKTTDFESRDLAIRHACMYLERTTDGYVLLWA